MKKTKGFVLGVIFTSLALVGAAHFGLVKIDITITDKGAALIEDGKGVLQDAQNQAVELYDEYTTEGE